MRFTLVVMLVLVASLARAQMVQEIIYTDSSKVTNYFKSDSISLNNASNPTAPVSFWAYVENLGAIRYLSVAIGNDTTAHKIIRIQPSDGKWIFGKGNFLRMRAPVDTTWRVYTIYRVE